MKYIKAYYNPISISSTNLWNMDQEPRRPVVKAVMAHGTVT